MTGTVTDPVNAVIPGVTIRIRNAGTNITRTIQTDEEGGYTITNLPPGPYDLAADVKGFRGYQQTGIVLEMGQTLRRDIRLEVGQVSESVSVTAEVTVLNTDSGAIKGDVIVQQEIEELPLEGRDFTDLALLVPGVMPKAEGGQGSALNVNGARADSTNFYVDGFNNRNAKGAAAQVRPNMGAMQEFKMEVSGYSAEYGRMAGGILNMVMRSGTNQYHGDVFEYVRNNIADARAFFDTEKLKLNRHQYGATFHGPVWLPKLYNGHSRTFFMFSWESYRQLVGVTGIAHVPSLLERAGDFSQSFSLTSKQLTVTDPLAKTPFPGNLVPASRFHPISAKLMEYYPQPNRADRRNNYITATNDKDAWDSFIVKADHRFNESNSMAYRYQKRFNNTSAPYAGGPLGIFGEWVNDFRSLMGADFTHLFSPSFLVEFHSGFSRNAQDQNSVWAGRDIAADLGLTGTTHDPDLLGFPLFNISDYAQMGSDANYPIQFHVTDIQNGVKFTLVKARHVMKWGFDHSRVRYNQPFFNNNRGTFTFNGNWSGAPLADFLLGMMNQSTRTVGWNRNYLRATSMGAFFNDDFKVRPNLTLNLGMRYEIDLTPYDRYDHLSNFVPSLAKIVLASAPTAELTGLIARVGLQEHVTFASEAGLPRSLVHGDFTNFGPRSGFAWTPWKNRRTVLRGGYGIFYTGYLLNPFRNQLSNTFPYTVEETYSRNSSRPDLVTLSNPFPVERQALGGVNTSSGYDISAPTGYLQSYNLTVERDFGGGAAIEIGYAGSKGTHLGRMRDVNLPRRSVAAYLAGIPTVDLRPFPFLNGTVNYFSFNSNSIYNAGQVSLRKRGRGGSFYRISYSYSKSIDDVSQIQGNSDAGLTAAAQDVTNFRLDRGRSDWDRGHVLTASYSWVLPVGRGRLLFGSARGWKQNVVGGWQLSGTAFFATGAPLTPVAADVNLNLGESQKPNRLGKGVPEEIVGQRRGVDYPWFVLDDFEKVPQCISVTAGCPPSPNGFLPFVYGNSGRNILDGPGLAYFNASLMKNFRWERKNIQFRCDGYNAMNHPNFNMPNRQFNASNGGLITGVASTGRGGRRAFQAGLKFQF
ncbi:MAG: carboxypeptidase regulatory-like domain-containing protein [Bryobacteraceae bacterium]